MGGFSCNISTLRIPGRELSSKAAQGRVEIDLALVTYNRSAKLTRFARDCVSENVCAANAEGAWIDKIYFGSLIRFNIDKKKLEAALKTKATGRAKAEFSYARSNLNIAGGYIGMSSDEASNTSPEKTFVNTVLELLETQGVVEAGNLINQRVDYYGVVAVVVAQCDTQSKTSDVEQTSPPE